MRGMKKERPADEPEAPWWWKNDDDASDANFAAMRDLQSRG